MKLYDIRFLLNSEQIIKQVDWGSPKAEELYHLLFSSWITRGLKASSVFAIGDSDTLGEFSWDKEILFYEKLPAPDGGFYLLLKKKDNRDYLFMQALDLVREGIQIYDKDACAVYFNKASRAISQIPESVEVEGRHLLDMYDLDEGISTVLTCTRTGSPVINRVDHYKTNDDVSIATANTAYPIRKGKELTGSVVFEQDKAIVNSCMNKMTEIEKALKLYETHGQNIRFSGYTFDNIIGHGEKLRAAVTVAKKVAGQDSSVMLVGETGTGKEIFAQSIHRESPRKNGKFVAINCAAVPDTLIESVLFGTQKGSFTGSENKPGYFEEANGGTLFLDELNSMSLSMQSKILRALQESTFRRVGGQKDIHMDVRIISSCNEDPFQAMEGNHFRKDLFYRLSTVMIELPPVREHIEDLEELIREHLNDIAYQYVHAFANIVPEVMQIFRTYQWPGNVRELFHILDYAQNVADSDTLRPEHLPTYLIKKQETASAGHPLADCTAAPSDLFSSGHALSLQTLMDQYENVILKQALEHYGCNITKTAEALGLRRQSLQYRITKYGLQL